MWFSYVSKWLWNIHHHQNAEKKFFQKQIWFRNGASITAWNTSRYPPFHNVWKLQKCCISISEFGIFQQVLSAKIDLSGVTLFDRKIQVFKKSPKLTFFGIFYELLSTQNVNVARFAPNVEWLIDFFKTGDPKLATGTSWKKRRLLQFIISLTLSKLFFVSVKVLENNASKYQVSKLT